MRRLGNYEHEAVGFLGEPIVKGRLAAPCFTFIGSPFFFRTLFDFNSNSQQVYRPNSQQATEL